MKKNNQYFAGCLMLSLFFCCNGIVLADNQDAELREQALSLFKPLDSATNAINEKRYNLFSCK